MPGQPTPEQREKHKDTYNWDASELQMSLHAIELLIVHDARDWAASNRDARLWAIVCGWDDESYEQMRRKHGWTDETIANLKRRHKAYEEAAGKMPSEMVHW